MIAKGKSDHEFAFMLDTPMDRNPVTFQKCRRCNLGFVPEEFRACFGLLEEGGYEDKQNTEEEVNNL
jgi:hypothetical protein